MSIARTAEQPQPVTFAALVVRTARQHEELVDRLHAAADRAGISHDEADALLVDEIDAGPVDLLTL